MDFSFVIGMVICGFIVLLGIGVYVKFISINKKISDLNAVMEKDRKSKKGGAKKVGKAYQEAGDVYDFEDMINHRSTFNKYKVEYMVAEQIVPIFPLMGLLGTVIGLISMLSNGGFTKSGLGTSLYTTLAGLIVAIVLKYIDAKSVSKAINEMEMEFDEFDYKYRMVNDKSLVESEMQE